MIRRTWTYKLTAALAAVAIGGAVAALPAGAGQRHKPRPDRKSRSPSWPPASRPPSA